MTENDIKQLYEPFGEIEQINLLKRDDGKPVGCGFVQFKRIEDASKAIFQTNKQDFLGRKINSAWAIPKAQFVKRLDEEAAGKSDEIVEVPLNDEVEQTSSEPRPVREKKKLTPEERKEHKEKKRRKRARIVIRNLSFKVCN